MIMKYSSRIQRYILELQTRGEYILSEKKEEIYSRNKLTINYKWPTMPLTFYVSYEHFTQLHPSIFADKYRVILGSKYLFTKKMTLSAFWGFQKEFSSNSYPAYILGWKAVFSIKNKYKNKKDTPNDFE